MKTQIIHIEPGDDIVSLCDKLSWGKTDHVLLISEDNNPIQFSRYGFRFIARAAKKKGIIIGLVSKIKNERRAAEEAGIQVFNSIREGQTLDWKIPPEFSINRKVRLFPSDLRAKRSLMRVEETGWKNSTITRMLAFIVGVFSMFILMGFLFPSATIFLHNQQKENVIQLELTAYDGSASVDATSGVPLKNIQVTVDGNQINPVTTTAVVADHYATGTEDFTNQTDQIIHIPSGTIVASSSDPGIRFEVTSDSDLPAGRGQKISLPIKALTPGLKSNLTVNTIQLIIGELGFSAEANNSAPTLGGTEKVTPFPGNMDREVLTEQLESKFKELAIHNAKSQLGNDVLLFPDIVQLSEIQEKKFIPEAGQPGAQLSLRMTAVYSITYASVTNILFSAKSIIQGKLSKDYVIVQGSQKIELVPPFIHTSNGELIFDVEINQKIEKELNLSKIALSLRGMSISKAQDFLERNLEIEKPPKFVMYPSWWPVLPYNTLQFNFIQQQ